MKLSPLCFVCCQKGTVCSKNISKNKNLVSWDVLREEGRGSPGCLWARQPEKLHELSRGVRGANNAGVQRSVLRGKLWSTKGITLSWCHFIKPKLLQSAMCKGGTHNVYIMHACCRTLQ